MLTPIMIETYYKFLAKERPLMELFFEKVKKVVSKQEKVMEVSFYSFKEI